MATTVASRKAKGRNLQYWTAKRICKLFDIEFDSQDDLCPIKSRPLGVNGVDVFITDRRMSELFPFDIECKNTEKVSLYEYIKQASANTLTERDWLVIHKKNHSKPIAIVDAEVFFSLVEENIKLKEK